MLSFDRGNGRFTLQNPCTATPIGTPKVDPAHRRPAVRSSLHSLAACATLNSSFLAQNVLVRLMKIERYQLVGADTDKDLEIQVSNLIAQGWQPFGSLAVIATADKASRYYQAMVLTENASANG